MASSGGGAAAARMDPEAATELARKGVTLLLLDVPQHTVLGLDTQVFSVGPRFRGIKMVPPGPHFLHYCSPSRHGNEFAPTVGFFLTTHPSQVVVRRWHAQEERLVTLSEEEEIRYSEAVKRFEFDDQLGPYNLDSFGDWKQLSSYLSQSVIERLEPIGGEITIALEASWMDRAPQTDMERRLMEQLREDKFAKKAPAQPERRGCYYTTIPASVKHRNISADELTLLNLDRVMFLFYYLLAYFGTTSLLETVLAKSYQGQEDLLLGELQFSFIAFMMGQSLEAFMQWKALVSLLLSCSEAGLENHTELAGYPNDPGSLFRTLAHFSPQMTPFGSFCSKHCNIIYSLIPKKPLHTRTQMFVKFIRVIYYQFKHGFQRTHDSRSSEDKGNSLFLDEAWFSRDIFLYRLSKDFLAVIFEAQVVDGDLLSWFAPVVVEMDGS
uniref:Protein AAR2 homolog n=1 Tax=Aegilops tauschii TaxID=37682 RepID=M8BUL2_AEGTA